MSRSRLWQISATRTDTRPASVTLAVPALATIALGLMMLFCVGFLQVSAVHNGAHDTRHTNGFPCH